MTTKELLRKAETILDVDKHALDDEWVEQPRNVFLFTQALENARANVDRLKVEADIAKEEVKRAEAEIELAIRKSPGRFKIDKPTEGAIKAAVEVSESRKATLRVWRDVQLKLIDAEHEAGVLGAVCKALENKKKALEDLVVLQGRSYFAEPRAPKEDNGHMEEVERQNLRKSVPRG